MNVFVVPPVRVMFKCISEGLFTCVTVVNGFIVHPVKVYVGNI